MWHLLLLQAGVLTLALVLFALFARPLLRSKIRAVEGPERALDVSGVAWTRLAASTHVGDLAQEATKHDEQDDAAEQGASIGKGECRGRRGGNHRGSNPRRGGKWLGHLVTGRSRDRGQLRDRGALETTEDAGTPRNSNFVRGQRTSCVLLNEAEGSRGTLSEYAEEAAGERESVYECGRWSVG